MTRTQRRKWAYLLVVVSRVGLAAAILLVTRSPWVGVVLVGLLLIPGRVHGHFWRPLFRGRRRAAAGDHEGAIQEYDAFLQRLSGAPLSPLCWRGEAKQRLDIPT